MLVFYRALALFSAAIGVFLGAQSSLALALVGGFAGFGAAIAVLVVIDTLDEALRAHYTRTSY